jgi:hypothetical protein
MSSSKVVQLLDPLDEGPEHAPRILRHWPPTQRNAPLLDLNPQFAEPNPGGPILDAYSWTARFGQASADLERLLVSTILGATCISPAIEN